LPGLVAIVRPQMVPQARETFYAGARVIFYTYSG